MTTGSLSEQEDEHPQTDNPIRAQVDDNPLHPLSDDQKVIVNSSSTWEIRMIENEEDLANSNTILDGMMDIARVEAGEHRRMIVAIGIEIIAVEEGEEEGIRGIIEGMGGRDRDRRLVVVECVMLYSLQYVHLI